MQWSFGVTCWEVFSGGNIPYSGISPMALLQLLCDEERLSKPPKMKCEYKHDNCSQQGLSEPYELTGIFQD